MLVCSLREPFWVPFGTGVERGSRTELGAPLSICKTRLLHDHLSAGGGLHQYDPGCVKECENDIAIPVIETGMRV